MKIIKIIALLLLSVSLNAQTTIEQNIPVVNANHITVDFPYATIIKINTWNKKHIAIKANIAVDNGKLDHHFKLKTEEHFNTIKIASTYGKLIKKKKQFFDFFSNKDKAIVITRHAKGESVSINGITIKATYTVYVPEGLELELKSSTGNVFSTNFVGDLTTDITNGNVSIGYYQGNISIKTVKGNIDIKIDDTSIVKAKTTTGKIFKVKYIPDLIIGEKTIGSFAIRNGKRSDHTITLNSVVGDIYLKKQSL